MNSRGSWQGMLTILRFNWPFYLAASVILILSLTALLHFNSVWLNYAAAVSLLGSGYFLILSLGVSHLIYDRSDLYRWNWLNRALACRTNPRVVFCHSGFDEASFTLEDRIPHAAWFTLDHFDAARMTEASIRRARRRFPPTPGTLAAPFDRWPVESESADVIFALLAIHEFRSEEERSAWFQEAARCLQPEGIIILAEHLRDIPNFMAFGPGFLHFHSAASWRRCWENATLRSLDEFSITPWVRIFIISRND